MLDKSVGFLMIRQVVSLFLQQGHDTTALGNQLVFCLETTLSVFVLEEIRGSLSSGGLLYLFHGLVMDLLREKLDDTMLDSTSELLFKPRTIHILNFSIILPLGEVRGVLFDRGNSLLGVVLVTVVVSDLQHIKLVGPRATLRLDGPFQVDFHATVGFLLLKGSCLGMRLDTDIHDTRKIALLPEVTDLCVLKIRDWGVAKMCVRRVALLNVRTGVHCADHEQQKHYSKHESQPARHALHVVWSSLA
mmetsp:Transcript_1030/g.2223  ORF Transcript_1030/g.2223 Transcript_1030/m.2223 type:complete len:247 (-) Transcript_1030:25-765(-)